MQQYTQNSEDVALSARLCVASYAARLGQYKQLENPNRLCGHSGGQLVPTMDALSYPPCTSSNPRAYTHGMQQDPHRHARMLAAGFQHVTAFSTKNVRCPNASLCDSSGSELELDIDAGGFTRVNAIYAKKDRMLKTGFEPARFKQPVELKSNTLTTRSLGRDFPLFKKNVIYPERKALLLHQTTCSSHQLPWTIFPDL